MNLLKTSMYSGLENIVKLASGVILLKIVAVSGGAEDVALFGQFQNVYAITIAVVAGAFAVGGVKFIAQSKESRIAVKDIIKDMIVFVLPFAILTVLLALLFSKSLSRLIFFSADYDILLKLISPMIFLVAAYHIFIATLNGLGEITKYILAKLSVSLILILGAIFAYIDYQFSNFIVLYVTSFSLAAVFAYFLVPFSIRKSVKFNIVDFLRWKTSSKKFIGFWGISLVAGVSTPVVMIFIRQILSARLGIEFAGYWEAVTRLSEVYLVVVTGAMLTYYIPALSRLKTKNDVQTLVFKIGLFAVLVAIPVSITLYLNRSFLIDLFLDENFAIIERYFSLSLTTSVIKILSWVFSYYLIAKGTPFIPILLEFVFSVLLVVSVYTAVILFGFDGVFYASLVNSILFLLATFAAYQYSLKEIAH